MTEDEAKGKTCVQTLAGISDLTGGVFHAPCACIASACMAWRVRHQWFDNAQQEPDWVFYAPYGFEPGPGQERDDGYCGLVGEPR